MMCWHTLAQSCKSPRVTEANQYHPNRCNGKVTFCAEARASVILENMVYY